MSKPKRAAQRWVCQACGAVSSGWFGKCPSCEAWNSIEQELPPPNPGERPAGSSVVVASTDAQTQVDSQPRRPCGLAEVDRVLGGGLVPGSVVLLGGPPGIGKSTLLLQASVGLARRTGIVLYASGEESIAQVGSRCARLAASHKNLLLMAEQRIEEVLAQATDRIRGAAGQPPLGAVIVDSVQTVYSTAQDGLPGNITQIRAVTSQLVAFAKHHGVPVVVVGHVTKDGQLAGPRLLEHLVDAVLSFEGDEERATRLLRATKNRFGSTQELGVFEMRGDGLREIANPSEAFLTHREAPAIGSCVTATLEGSRPLLLEVQALLAASFGNPRRTCVGVDPIRLAMLMAVLDRHAGLFVLDQDVFVNVVGGMRLSEPASDLAVLLAIASSHRRQPLAPGTIAFGEIGLTGELRPVPRSETRVQEAARLGLKRVLLPAAPKQAARALKDSLDSLHLGASVELRFARTVAEAIELGFA
ncbi:MAG: DNA repair protein RadA [Nannocystis sp.]|uniref:DNA repair protein RadA n=1 Tax=Nannocystis sp. TaxID=1962667 RepID=UPI002422E92D|nr:DNA repair protein RadA [Nannocystis sp.]MBK9752234.1 DNA repair protein RadA [Nannocystis sp.]